MKNDKWYKLHAGKYTLNTWNGDSQLTYIAVKQDSGWVVSRKVDGGGLLIVAGPQPTFREARNVVQDDSRRGL